MTGTKLQPMPSSTKNRLPSIIGIELLIPGMLRAIVAQSNFSGSGPRPVGVNQAVSGSGVYDMAGNVREWCWNQTKGNRFILGGGWNDQRYMFMYAYTQDPFDRSPSNGFRCVRYQEVLSDTSSVLKEVDIPRRDFLKEKRASEETYKLYLRLYALDNTPLHQKVESIDSAWRGSNKR